MTAMWMPRAWDFPLTLDSVHLEPFPSDLKRCKVIVLGHLSPRVAVSVEREVKSL